MKRVKEMIKHFYIALKNFPYY